MEKGGRFLVITTNHSCLSHKIATFSNESSHLLSVIPQMTNQSERYLNLGYEEALTRNHLYPKVCKELSFILREAYNKLPKNLQFSIFQHTLAAFRILPQMETKSAVSAAQLLFQSAEATLPKQRKTMAIAEFKHAKVAHSRRSKSQSVQEGECTFELPHDVLLHIFSYLDVLSLVSVAFVCRSWNWAAGNSHLWQYQYDVYFGENHNSLRIEDRHGSPLNENKGSSTTYFDWRKDFQRACTGCLSKRLESFRGYCTHCKSIVWLDHRKCFDINWRVQSENQHIVPISPHQVVEYLLNDSWSMSSFSLAESDSESEEEEEVIPRLWTNALTDLKMRINRK